MKYICPIKGQMTSTGYKITSRKPIISESLPVCSTFKATNQYLLVYNCSWRLPNKNKNENILNHKILFKTYGMSRKPLANTHRDPGNFLWLRD